MRVEAGTDSRYQMAEGGVDWKTNPHRAAIRRLPAALSLPERVTFIACKRKPAQQAR